MLKAGILGVGNISNAHIPPWDAIEDVQLTAMCDIRPEQMKPYQDRHCYTDFDEMLEKEPLDILDICLPTFLHADFAVRALEKGIHVLCEKPVSLHKEDVKRIYDAARRGNAKFMVAQVVRFWPEYLFIKELYETGKFGRLLSGSMERIGTTPGWSWENWFRDEKRSGLVPYDLHVHDLDFMVYAFGRPKKTHSFRSKREEQDHIHAVYEFDGFTVSADTAWYAAKYPFSCTFRFQFEHAVAEKTNSSFTVYLDEGRHFDTLQQAQQACGFAAPGSNAYANEIAYFADCVKNDRAPEIVRPDQLETVIDILNHL